MNLKKILIVAGSLDMGGVEKQLVHLAKIIDKKKYLVHFTCTNPNPYYKTELLMANCIIKVMPDPREAGTLKYCMHMLNLMKEEKYDIVHAHKLFHSGIDLFIACIAGVPKRIAHAHSTRDGHRHNKVIRAIYHCIMRGSILCFGTDYIACSTEAGKYLYGTGILKNRNFKVIFNSVETIKYFLPNNDRLPFKKKDGWIYVTHIGRFSYEKNHDFIIDIAKEAKKVDDKMMFILVGNGDLLNGIEERIRLENLSDYVICLGLRTDVEDILKNSDAFILPSLYEGMPLTLIEAQAAGIQCLVADHITCEADYGIGLFHKESIKISPKIWHEKLQHLVAQPMVDKNIVQEAIDSKGFKVEDFALNLCRIYSSGDVYEN
ncbi:MAG: glycosyltransferase [Eubacteriales bacterium]